MAAPVALSGSGKYGVMVGMSLSSLPSAPGAPSGHKGIGSLVSARIRVADNNRAASVEKVFMVDLERKHTRNASGFNDELDGRRVVGSFCLLAARWFDTP